MRVVAYVELVVLARVFIGALTFQSSIIAPIIFAHFLRQRYYQSSFTREAISTTDANINKYAHKDGTPPVAGQVWDKVRLLIGRWAGSTLASQPAAAGARR
jgi:transmembrane protein 33